jgi:CTD kinase subunit alpha
MENLMPKTCNNYHYDSFRTIKKINPIRAYEMYEQLDQVGEGTYGKVYKGRCREKGEFVALKRIRMECEKEGFPITSMREIKLLQQLSHVNILCYNEIVTSKSEMYMVFDYMDYDLTGILAHPTLSYSPEHIKCLMYQIINGLQYLHGMGILHRDIKGSNILLNKRGILKLGDFGLARLHALNHCDYTNRVITLWYRPPELLLGSTSYGPEVDIWGVGCIMMELFFKKPCFRGVDEISQLDSIYRILGTPNTQNWPGIVELPWYHLITPTNILNSEFRNTFGSSLSTETLNLLEKMFSYNPDNRISAADALNSDYFKEEPLQSSPENLPCPEGDWHEYETKIRRKKEKDLLENDSKKKKSKKGPRISDISEP